MGIRKLIIVILFLIIILGLNSCQIQPEENKFKKPEKLYWFIPDGMRAEPDLFNIYEWAQNGELPNIKKMMDNGAYGYSVPVFPTHTPVNFATLLTGSYPKTHGVADGPMHIEGRPLDKVAIGGFSSTARKVPAIWSTLETDGKKVLVLSTPGSTPPEIGRGIVIRGRWGGWGADIYSVNFESRGNNTQRVKQGRGSRLFFFGPELTKYIDSKPAEEWQNIPSSFSPALEIEMVAWGKKIYGYIYDSTDDSKINYDGIIFSFDKKTVLADLKEQEWSSWHQLFLNWQNLEIESDMMFHPIILDDGGFFRVRVFFSNLNDYITQPSEVSDELVASIGPMIDFVDNFPAQLIYYPEDKKTFLQEMNLSFRWHTAAIPFMMSKYEPDVVIHDVYSPNQMLTSRWWLGYIDPQSARYNKVTEEEREQLMGEVKWMYKQLDNMVGEIMENADENTLIVLSSDHGAAPLDKWVRLNNLFAKEGLLKFEINKETGEPIIDWNNSKVIYLKMDNIYINPNGLAGDYKRASGQEYENLRNKVIDILINLQDENGKKPIATVTKWEDVEKFLDLPKDRVGDLIVANEIGYGWNEEMTENLAVFDTPLETGYKQAVLPDEKAMWTPFIIMGPGVKKGYEIKGPLEQIHQYPTIMNLLGLEIPEFVDGKPLEEIFDNP
ncbi:alkaline phosphatase family protein [Candidatus Woesearchaeota archaeon]|nr:alkaline phosphatase family protein [Candidatus Woesearchaeota archaeon]